MKQKQIIEEKCYCVGEVIFISLIEVTYVQKLIKSFL